MIKYTYIVIFLAILASVNLRAQVETLSTWSDAIDLVNNSASAFVQGNYEAAYSRMQPYWPIAGEDVDRVLTRTADLMPDVIDQYGDPVDFHILRETLVGEHLGRLEVLIRCEVYGIRLVYEFYRAPDGWVLTSFLWNERLGDFFE